MRGAGNFSVALVGPMFSLSCPWDSKREVQLNSEICKKALEKVGNPNILVNLVSRRVRQLTSGGPGSRPFIADTAGLGAADIAMLELIEDKLEWSVTEPTKAESPKKRKT
jgi:DNA-directed RNA polymerase subunit omega